MKYLLWHICLLVLLVGHVSWPRWTEIIHSSAFLCKSEYVCVFYHLLCLQTARLLQCNLCNETCRNSLKWIRWRDGCITSPLCSASLVYCSSYSAKMLIDCLCSYTLVNLRSVGQSGLNCQDGRTNCITVKTRRPRSAPLRLCHTQKGGEVGSSPAQSLCAD